MEALCAEHLIRLIKVDDNKELGDGWASVKSTERESPTKWLVKDCGREVQAKNSIEEYFSCRK